jgi:hypothetical protein
VASDLQTEARPILTWKECKIQLMRMTSVRFAVLILFLLVSCPSLFAQRFELYPYAGGAFSKTIDELGGKIKDQGIYGARFGVSLTDHFDMDGNFGYLNHFEFSGTDPKARGFLYELAGTWNFTTAMLRGVEPYVSFGAAGLTTKIKDDDGLNPDTFITEDGTRAVILNPNRPAGISRIIMESGDTFFNFSYGGGVKAVRLWGPLGLRGDIRGRTFPNFYGETLNWFEPTGGIILTWGER